MPKTPLIANPYVKINIRAGTKAKLDKLVIREHSTQLQLLDDMVDFMQKTGINPRVEYESSSQAFTNLANLIKKRTDTIISFFKKNEESITIPTLNKVSDILELMADKDIEAGKTQRKPKSEQIVPTRGQTVEYDKLIRLREENEELHRYLAEVVSKIQANTTVTRTVVYHLNISESFYNELKLKFSE